MPVSDASNRSARRGPRGRSRSRRKRGEAGCESTSGAAHLHNGCRSGRPRYRAACDRDFARFDRVHDHMALRARETSKQRRTRSGVPIRRTRTPKQLRTRDPVSITVIGRIETRICPAGCSDRSLVASQVGGFCCSRSGPLLAVRPRGCRVVRARSVCRCGSLASVATDASEERNWRWKRRLTSSMTKKVLES